MDKQTYRHGDLFLRPVDELEGKAVENNGSFVLAEGETTGHKHLLTVPRLEVRRTEDGRYFLSFDSEAKLGHEEHQTITLQPGKYEVIREREYDWFQKAARQVVD